MSCEVKTIVFTPNRFGVWALWLGHCLWRVAVFVWMALLTWRYLKFGIQELPLLLVFAGMVSVNRIARAIERHANR